MSALPPDVRAWVTLQADIGVDEVFFDEPLVLPELVVAKPVVATSAPTKSEDVEIPPPQVKRVAAPKVAAKPTPTKPVESGSIAELNLSLTSGKDALAGLDSVQTISELNSILHGHELYRKGGELMLGSGPLNPAFMFIAFLPSEDAARLQSFLAGDPGELLRRLLTALKIEPNLCYNTWFCKQLRPKAPMPREISQMRRMLEAEVRIVAPQAVIALGEKAMQAMFGIGDDLRTGGGVLRSFAGVPATAIEDPVLMLRDPALKTLTWNEHIPRSGLFPTRLAK